MYERLDESLERALRVGDQRDGLPVERQLLQLVPRGLLHEWRGYQLRLPDLQVVQRTTDVYRC